MQEIWKDIKGYEGLYQVSNFGEVKSLERPYINQYGKYGLKKEKILNKKIVCFDKNKKEIQGYYAVNLSNKDRGKWKRLHIIVATAFLKNPENKKEINHKNGNKLDNRVENLEWVTHKENCLHAWKTGLHKNEEERIRKIKEKNKILKKITKDMILDIFKNCVFGDKQKNAHYFAGKYGIALQTVCNIKNLKNETYKRIVKEELCK